MAKLKSAATNKKIQGAFMDVKNNGVSAAMKYRAVWKSNLWRVRPEVHSTQWLISAQV